MRDDLTSRWFPIASSRDLPYRHVFHAQLLGRELAVWRADDDHVNVWENRCLHRGVRLTVGINEGFELKCQYHGWRYANRSAACTYIPAHPADAPARSIRNRRFAAVERHGLVWSGEAPEGEPPQVEGAAPWPLRPVPVHASTERVLMALASDYVFQPNARIAGRHASVAAQVEGFAVTVVARDEEAETTAVFFVQPVEAGRSIIRGVLRDGPAASEAMAVLRHHDKRLSALRDRLESEPAATIEPWQVEWQPVPPELAAMPEPKTTGRQAALRVRVAEIWAAAQDIKAFRLVPLQGELPDFQPGAHIDVHLPNGLIRQYSLTNGPRETSSYIIAVKREDASRGGSRCLHDVVREGDVLAISAPRNNFPLRRDAVRTLLMAGGIGITPLIAMAKTLHMAGLPFDLHCFARSVAHLAFAAALEELAPAVHVHLGLDGAATTRALEEVLRLWAPDAHVYVCGPVPLLETTRALAERQGWPEAHVHYEYFGNARPRDDRSSFEVALARSCLTVPVRPGQTIVEALRARGVDIATSCEQGACGTCLTTVLEGEVDHQDVYLSEGEKRRGVSMLPCVSRAKSARLVLDI